jgi:hypothetical protein
MVMFCRLFAALDGRFHLNAFNGTRRLNKEYAAKELFLLIRPRQPIQQA